VQFKSRFWWRNSRENCTLKRGRLSLKSNFLSPRERLSRPRLSLSKRRKMPESPELREQTSKCALNLEDQPPKLKLSLSTKREHLKILVEENK